MHWLIPLGFVALFETLADIFAKEWQLAGRGIKLGCALLFYTLASSFWLIALKSGSGLARGVLLFSVMCAVAGTFVGLVLFKEELSRLQGIGMLVGFLAIVLLMWE